jgi:ABC-type nitrate/sulfonate/bicarbonate transport system substrate-binding protein
MSRSRVLATTLGLLVVLATVACGSDDPEASSATAAPEESTTTAPAADAPDGDREPGELPAGVTPGGEPVTITIGYPGPSLSYLGLIVADHMGYFEEENITVEFTQVAPPVGVSATLAGDLDYNTVYGSSIRAAATGLELTAVAVLMDKPIDTLMVDPAITDVDDLDGKTIGVDAIGATTDIVTREALTRSGFDPESANFVVSGDESARYQQLLGGQIDAALLGPTARIEAEAEGMVALVPANEVIDLPLSGLVTSNDKIENDMDEIVRVLRAAMRGQEVLLADRETALELISEFLELEGDLAEGSYDLALPSWSRTLEVSDEVMEFELDVDRRAGNDIPEDLDLDKVRNFDAIRSLGQEFGI